MNNNITQEERPKQVERKGKENEDKLTFRALESVTCVSATLLFFFGGSVELVWVDVCSFTDEVTWLSREISDELGKGMLRFAGVGEGCHCWRCRRVRRAVV